jgi:restriction system protein
MTTIKEQISSLISKIDNIPSGKNYWLIRTEAGSHFESFNNFNFVALGYEEITYKIVKDFKENSLTDVDFRNQLKAYVLKQYPDKQAGLITNQILKFIFEVKKGDIVVIPSENSDFISMGEITDDNMLVHSESTFNSTNCDYTKRKSVKWIKTFTRKNLDPYLYKTFQAHQAINNISSYANIIERSLGDFYKIGDEVNLVFGVNKESNIKAADLLFFGSDLLTTVEGFIKEYNLDFDISDIDVKINVNSQGKMQFLSKSGKNLLLLGIISMVIIGLNGGGLKIDRPGFKLDLSTDGLIKTVSDYLDRQQDRAMKERLINSAKSLEIKTPEDLIKLTKQFSDNKDLPK